MVNLSYETVRIVKEGRKATLILNRPDAMNAMNEVMLKELAEVFETLSHDKQIQVLVLKGEGRAFSAGGDIKMMLEKDQPEDFERIMEYISRLMIAFYQLPMITVAQIHGAAAGLGFSLALACDFVVAEENSKLAMNFIGIGLVPDGGGHFFMKERVGTFKAKQIIWEGKVMDAEKALQLGLIDAKTEVGKAPNYVDEWVTNMLHSPILAKIETKRLLHGVQLSELKNVLKSETDAQLRMRKTKDHLEGIKAFLEKRSPIFTGS